MKRLVSLLAIAALIFSGCGNKQDMVQIPKSEYEALKSGSSNSANNSGSNVTDKTPVKKTQEAFNESDVISKLEVKTFQYVNPVKGAWSFLEVKNNSEFNVDISANVTFKNVTGELIGAKTGSKTAVEKGSAILLSFRNDEKPSTMDYKLSVKETGLKCVVSELSKEVTSAKGKAIISVTNNGKEDAEFVQYDILFFNGDNLVDHGNGGCTNGDSKLPAGATISAEESCYEKFDSTKVYLTGLR